MEEEFKLAKFYFNKIWGISFIISIPVNLFIILLSYLPWIKEGQVNTWTVISILCLALTTFGPLYITYYTTLIRGIKNIRTSKGFLIHTTIQSIFWPIFFLILTNLGFFVWFWYFDFLYFIFAFLPLSFHTAYSILYKRIDNQSIENRERTDSVSSPPEPLQKICKVNSNLELMEQVEPKTKPISRFKFGLYYALVELIVIVSALSYTFFLIPYFIKFPDLYKILWRLFLHPLWFEFTMLLPQRLLSKTMDQCDSELYLRFIPVLHAIFHSCTIGRMMLLSIDNIVVSLYLNILVNVQEIILRITMSHRDQFLIRLYGADIDNKEIDEIHGCVVNVEMMMEIVGIFVSPFFMLFFAGYGDLFTFNMGYISVTNIIITSILQLILEIITDLICVMYENKINNIRFITLWNKMINKRMIGFLIYGMMTMGVLGMVYTGLLLPRAVFCSTYTRCSI